MRVRVGEGVRVRERKSERKRELGGQREVRLDSGHWHRVQTGTLEAQGGPSVLAQAQDRGMYEQTGTTGTGRYGG